MYMHRYWLSFRQWGRALTDVIFPKTCEVCGRSLIEGEDIMCLHCLNRLPRTNFHILKDSSPVLKMTSEAKIFRMASMFYYTKHSGYAAMLKKSKYNHHPEIDRKLGIWFAEELKAAGFFDGVDYLVPVPMYKWKKFFRGFNQSEEIAKGIEKVTGIPVVYNLETSRPHKTQTRKTAAERITLPSDLFWVYAPHELYGKHLLLIDDIVTTGGTVAACSAVLRAAVPSVRISLLSLAHTSFS